MNLACDCLITNMWEIDKDGAEMVGIITDHGNRHDQDHFVIVVIWSGLDKQGHPTYKYFCPSIDSAGHTAKQASDAIRNVLAQRLKPGTEIFCATADAGGGGSIDNTYPILTDELKVMPKDSKETNCAIHGWQKALENASKLTMGDQGLGARSPFQMLWVFSKLIYGPS